LPVTGLVAQPGSRYKTELNASRVKNLFIITPGKFEKLYLQMSGTFILLYSLPVLCGSEKYGRRAIL
jgi:hypothetical protein